MVRKMMFTFGALLALVLVAGDASAANKCCKAPRVKPVRCEKAPKCKAPKPTCCEASCAAPTCAAPACKACAPACTSCAAPAAAAAPQNAPEPPKM
ncbi:MAG: hypothetical protein DWH91_14275 [Planctomycetota bacterium]|nr:MAG: hypothetical protein DWH91_14275 [Planctomycetota bacterium]